MFAASQLDPEQKYVIISLITVGYAFYEGKMKVFQSFLKRIIYNFSNYSGMGGWFCLLYAGHGPGLCRCTPRYKQHHWPHARIYHARDRFINDAKCKTHSLLQRLPA